MNSNNKNFVVENECVYDYNKTILRICFTKNKTVQLKDTVTTIYSNAFTLAINIEEINFPNSVTTIQANVFSRKNTKLKKINIGANVVDINPLFKNRNYYGTVTIDENNSNYTVEKNVLYNKDRTEIITVFNEIHGKFVVADTVAKIGEYAFYYQNKMTEIELHNGIKQLGSMTFSYTGLTSINIPNSIEIIEENTFSGINSLEHIYIDKKEGDIKGAPWGAIKGNRIVEWLR